MLVVAVPPAEPAAMFSDPRVTEAVVLAYYRSYEGYLARLGDCASDVTSGASVPVSEPGSTISVGSSASSGRAARRARWRANKKSSASAVSYTVDGLPDRGTACFNKLLRQPVKPELDGALSFDSVLRFSVDDLERNWDADSSRVCRVADGVYHLGTRGVPVRRCLADVVAASGVLYPHGTLGAALCNEGHVASGAPMPADRLGAGEPELVPAALTLNDVDRLLVIDAVDPAGFAMVAEVLGAVPGRVAVALIPRRVGVRVRPYGAMFGPLRDALVAAGLTMTEALRAMACAGVSVDRVILDSLPPVMLSLLVQDDGCRDEVVELYSRASMFRLQEYLATAGLDPRRVLHVTGMPASIKVTKDQVHMDDFAFSLPEREWRTYQRELAEYTASGDLDLLHTLRLGVLTRYARGHLLSRVCTRAEFARAAGRKSGPLDLLVGGPCVGLESMVSSKVFSSVWMVMSTLSDVGIYPADLTVMQSGGGCAAVLVAARDQRLPCYLLSAQAGVHSFGLSEYVCDELQSRHSSSVLFRRWGVRPGVPLLAWTLARAYIAVTNFKFTYVDLEFSSDVLRLVPSEQKTRIRQVQSYHSDQFVDVTLSPNFLGDLAVGSNWGMLQALVRIAK